MNTVLLTAWLLTQGCDFATTNVALSRGFVEGNPALGSSRTQINSIKVSVNVLAFVAWHKNKDKKGAIAIPIVMAATAGTACVWNAKALR